MAQPWNQLPPSLPPLSLRYVEDRTDCPTLSVLKPPATYSKLLLLCHREQLVSTLDAERALRVRTVEVPRIKAIAAREGSILSAAGKGMPYVVNPVALKVFTDVFSCTCAAVDPKDKEQSKPTTADNI